MTRRAILVFVLIGLLWGSAWVPTSEVLREIPPLRAGALRFAIAAMFTALLAFFSRLRSRKTGAQFSLLLFRHALILSLTALAPPYALVVWASNRISPAAIPALFAFMPLIVLLMSREAASGTIPALVIGISGVVLLVAQGLSFSGTQLGGTFLILCAVTLGAFSLNYAKKHLQAPEFLLFCSVQFAFASVLLGAVSFATERTQAAAPNTATALWILSLGILISGLTLPLLYWLLTQVEAWQTALLYWISTLVAVVEAAWLLHARPSTGQAIAAVAIIGAVLWLLSRPETVTLAATRYATERPAASDSEVGSK